jgi:hypothetical protein
MPTKVSVTDFNVSGQSIKLTGPAATAAVNSLVQNNGATMSELSSVLGAISPKDISIGQDGSVTINNADAAQKLQQLQTGLVRVMVDFNCICL